ncbi:MAG: glycosyltransferase family 9 protein [Tannerella sp.]|jgi:ADP-heptose:LPS heptosyltransferase|nr:glycosyltransferase family 9 protein [Tannerella sp.]
MTEVLIIRLSAIGDVAMTIPVIYSAARANPSDSFTVLTQTFLLPIFINRPKNVKLIGIHTKGSEKSLRGFLRFASALVRYRYDVVLDLHGVIRSRIIDWMFRVRGRSVFVLDKMRKERRRLVRKPPKDIRPLPDMVTRYADVFHAAGIYFDKTFVTLYDDHPLNELTVREIAGEKTGCWVGIAPFARYRGKIYPPEQMEKALEILSRQEGMSVFLFGAKGEEERTLGEWASRCGNTRSVAGRYSLDQELALISKLDVLLCMDSANMHFASLVGTKVISIWGATHPGAGFYGYRQPPELAIQTALPCRPCSIFGMKPCCRGDWACMTQITPESVAAKVNEFLEREKAGDGV